MGVGYSWWWWDVVGESMGEELDEERLEREVEE